jgi:hypothetical protein
MKLTSQQAHPTNPIQARKRIAHFYQQTQNSCKTAQRCHTAPQRVRKGGNATNNTADRTTCPKPKNANPKNRPPHKAARAATPPKKMSTRHGMAFLRLAGSWLRLCGVPTEMTIQTDWAGLGWGKAWGGSSPATRARSEAECLRLLGAPLGRVLLGRKEDEGRVARGHRTDEEAFYLPCVLLLASVEAFLGAGLGGWMITPMSVCVLGMGWRVGRRKGVVWRWVFRVWDM